MTKQQSKLAREIGNWMEKVCFFLWKEKNIFLWDEEFMPAKIEAGVNKKEKNLPETLETVWIMLRK